MRYWAALFCALACAFPAGAGEISTTAARVFKEVCLAEGSPLAAAEAGTVRDGWRRVEGSGLRREFAPGHPPYVSYGWVVARADDAGAPIELSLSEFHTGRVCTAALTVTQQSETAVESEIVGALDVGPPASRGYPFNGPELTLLWLLDEQRRSQVRLRIIPDPSGMVVHLTHTKPYR
jgi:hypothetical protein